MISLPGPQKGVDDFIVARGREAFDVLYQEAIALETFKAELAVPQLTYPATRVNQRYLDLALPEKGLVVIQSPMDTGKTEQTKRVVSFAESVLVLNHLVTLSRQSAARLGIAHYQDVNVERARKLVCSVDSLYKLGTAKPFDVLVLDEVGQICDHLLNSSTCAEMRERIQQVFAYHVRNAGLVVIQEARVSDVEVDYIRALREGRGEQPLCFVNEYKHQPRQIQFLKGNKSTAAVSQIKKALAAGERVLVPTNSKEKAKALFELLRSLFPDKSIRAIHGDNSGEADNIHFINQINQRLPEVDCLIYSPTIRAGLTIDVPHFNQVIAIFESGRVPALELEQMLFRFRPHVPITVWSADRGYGYIGDSSPSRLLEQERTANHRSGILLRVNPQTGAITDGPHLEAWARINARNHSLLRSQRESLRQLLLDSGHRLIEVQEEEDPEVKGLMKQCRAQIREEHAIAVERAEPLTPAGREMLDFKDTLTEAERLQVQKYDLARTTQLEVTAELVLLDQDHGLQSAIVACEEMLEPDLTKERDRESFNRYKFLPDRRRGCQKAMARRCLQLLTFLEQGQTWTNASLQSWREELINPYRQDIERTLGLTIPKSASNTWVAGKLLAQVGIPTTSKQVGGRGNRQRVYRVNTESQVYQLVTESLQRRREYRERSETKLMHTSPYKGEINQGSVHTPARLPSRYAYWVGKLHQVVKVLAETGLAMLRPICADPWDGVKTVALSEVRLC